MHGQLLFGTVGFGALLLGALPGWHNGPIPHPEWSCCVTAFIMASPVWTTWHLFTRRQLAVTHTPYVPAVVVVAQSRKFSPKHVPCCMRATFVRSKSTMQHLMEL